jgi:hypothetical protein
MTATSCPKCNCSPCECEAKTHYPKTKEELNSVYQKALKEHTTGDPETSDYDWWCSSDSLWIDKHPAPEGQVKVKGKDGYTNLDPCRIIMTGNSTKTQIEVPLSIYEEWIDEESIRMGIDPRTGNSLQ